MRLHDRRVQEFRGWDTRYGRVMKLKSRKVYEFSRGGEYRERSV